MDISIIIAVISGSIALINSYQLHNSRANKANEKKTLAEADKIIFDLKSQTIVDLQDQINDLKKEIELLKKQEYIHLTEKIRLEEVIKNLTIQNNELKKLVEDSDKEVKNLTMQINLLQKELTRFKNSQ